MKYLITGGTGFIGKHLTNTALKMGCEKIDIISRHKRKNTDKIEHHQIQLENRKGLEELITKNKPDVCIHLAWEGIPNFSKEFCERNMTYSRNLLDAIKQSEVKKVIVSGSCIEDYEGDLSADQRLLATTKKEIYTEYSGILSEKEISLCWAKVHYCYGVGQREKALIPYLIDKIKKGEHVTLKRPEDRNDYINVRDVADAILFMSHNDLSEKIYDIKTGKTRETQDIYNVVENLIKRKIGISTDSYTHKIKSSIKSWKPKVSLEEGVIEMLQEND